MIKFNAPTNKGRRIVGIGLSKENITRLQSGLPIHFSLEEVKLPYAVEILIFAGENEEEMITMLKEVGMDIRNFIDETKLPKH